MIEYVYTHGGGPAYLGSLALEFVGVRGAVHLSPFSTVRIRAMIVRVGNVIFFLIAGPWSTVTADNKEGGGEGGWGGSDLLSGSQGTQEYW